MRRDRINRWLLAVLLLLLAGWVVFTAGSLPPRVAVHFGLTGAADGFLSRGGYLALLGWLVALTAGVGAAWPAALARRGSSSLNIPHREHWLAPERRPQTAAFLQAHGGWLVVLTALLMAGVHGLILQAHQAQPPQLSPGALLPLLLGFGALVALWLWVLYRRFRLPAA